MSVTLAALMHIEVEHAHWFDLFDLTTKSAVEQISAASLQKTNYSVALRSHVELVV